MKASQLLILSNIMLFSTSSYAQCTLESAQTKMVETTNMMQVYNRQKITFIENDKALPAEFDRKFTAFTNRSNELVAQFGKETDANPDIGFADPVSQSLCDGYDELFAQYAPDDYEKKKVSLVPTTAGANCTSTGLWEQYGKVIQKQAELTKAGKFTDAENAEMMRLATKFGQNSTTDLAKACEQLNELEGIVNSK